MTTKLIDLIIDNQTQEAMDLIPTLTREEIDFQSKHGDTALIHASFKGYIEIVKLLLEKGANVGLKDRYGINASMRAYCNDHTEIAELLKTYKNQQQSKAFKIIDGCVEVKFLDNNIKYKLSTKALSDIYETITKDINGEFNDIL